MQSMWRNALLVALCFAAVPCEGSLRLSRRKAQDNSAESDNPFDVITDTVDAATGTVTDAAKDVTDSVEKGTDDAVAVGKDIPHVLVKPLMGGINIMRAEMCWARPDLMNHAPCMKFLGLHCEEGRTGLGICKKFSKLAEEKCQSEADAEKKKTYCDLAATLAKANKKFQPKASHDKDTDGDGIPDDKDPDIDNDGHKNEDDAFPMDPKEWNDLDGDGIGDNSDPDRDGDGYKNEEDGFPDDPTRHLDPNGDLDGDGVKNSEDVFPEDPKEWKDTDNDGIGDNADSDRDGDGHDNDKDKFPDDPSRWTDDMDGDGVRDEEDAFPNDPNEHSDRDGDGIGDNSDGYPDNANCHEPLEPCDQTVSDESGVGKLNKLEKGLPPQGYNEYHPDKLVEHENAETFTGDWQTEWPAKKETEQQSIGRICEKEPDNVWCKRYAVHGHFSR